MSSAIQIADGLSSAEVSVRLRRIWPELLIVIAIMGISILIVAPFTIRWITFPLVGTDSATHLQIARDMYEQGRLITPHFLYQLLVIGFYTLVPGSGWVFSAVLANLLPQVLCAALMYVSFRLVVENSEWRRSHANLWGARLICAALALGLLIFVPMIPVADLFLQVSDVFLLGYITPTVYHNPTFTVFRPVALTLYLFVSTFALGTRSGKHAVTTNLAWIGLMAGVTILCGLSKPNYLIVLLPALVLWLGWRWLRHKPNAWRYVILGVMLPATLFLGWQYYFTYITPTAQLEGSSIIFAPFEVIGDFVHTPNTLLLYLELSIAFPLTITVLFWQRARHDLGLHFAWLAAIVGASYMYLLAESGSRLVHGNFFWSAYITIFILNFAVVHLALREKFSRSSLSFDWRTGVMAVLFVAHFLSSFYYLARLDAWLNQL